ncbi:hypothetical protein [Lysobacter capsici]|uniref:hypothetical protein n=1 Tax=Lysobacter capsici TaxID=435897 RepID=UPI000448F9E3|nr:hypothetical protein [Lysobacter capsici]
MTEVTYRSPTVEDIQSVADRMRLSDVLEVAASHGHPPYNALCAAVAASTISFTAVIDGVPEGIFGVSHHGGMSAEVWMLGTDGLTRDPKVFFAETSRIMDGWLEQFAILHNFVDDENEVSKAWLLKSGFTLGEPVPYGVSQLPFRYFYRVGTGV